MVGSNRKRIDVIDKVLGKPVFAGDMKADRLLFAVVYRLSLIHI